MGEGKPDETILGSATLWKETVSGSGDIVSRREQSTVPIPLRGMEPCHRPKGNSSRSTHFRMSEAAGTRIPQRVLANAPTQKKRDHQITLF